LAELRLLPAESEVEKEVVEHFVPHFFAEFPQSELLIRIKLLLFDFDKGVQVDGFVLIGVIELSD
jgi:hypothetical protein